MASLSIYGFMLGGSILLLRDNSNELLVFLLFITCIIYAMVCSIVLIYKNKKWLNDLESKEKRIVDYGKKNIPLSLGGSIGTIAYLMFSNHDQGTVAISILAILLVFCSIPFIFKTVVDYCFSYWLIKKYRRFQ